MSKIIGIVGSRRRDSDEDLHKCRIEFEKLYQDGDRIVSGGCLKGGDRFAEVIAKKMGLSITIHFPDWSKYGRGAGFVRNSKIAEECDVLLAVVAPDRKGGTEDTIQKVEKLGKRVFLVE